MYLKPEQIEDLADNDPKELARLFHKLQCNFALVKIRLEDALFLIESVKDQINEATEDFNYCQAGPKKKQVGSYD